MTNKCTVLLLVSALLSGCASIVCPSSYPISLSSNVKNAKVTVYNRGEEVLVATEPTEIRLSPKGGYFVPADYRLVFEKDGCKCDEVKLETNFNWWYLGNILFGGLIGMLIVDPATGAMWEIRETAVVGSLKSLNPDACLVVEPESPPQESLPSWIFQPSSTTPPKGTPPQNGQSVELDQIPL